MYIAKLIYIKVEIMTKKPVSDSTPVVKDPHAKREAGKYENPIPSREFILAHLKKVEVPQKQWQIAESLALFSDEQKDALRRRLRAMERDGQLMSTRRGDYALVDKLDLICGRVLGHRDGFGFLVPDDGSADLFLAPGQMRGIFDGDRLLARVRGIDRRGRREGSIVEVIERKTLEIVGRLIEKGHMFCVEPDNKRVTQTILVQKEDLNGAVSGQFVVATIVEQPTFRTPARAAIKEVMGEHMAPGMEIDVAIRSHHIPYLWPAIVDEELAGLSAEVPEESKLKRVDLRDLPLVTIDGEDARDFDDAVYCEPRRGGGWRLLVAIADVSHYVLPGSGLDAEAVLRGTSVYFPEQVIPMLPEALSNGLCSLNPHVDRLCMVCEMSISATGRMTKYKFYEGVMNSKARLTYTETGALLKGSEADKKLFDEKRPGIRKPLENLYALYSVLRACRTKRGAIDFESTETRIVFGESRKIEKIVPTERNDAHKIIEECMLSANVAAARFLDEHNLPGLYRVHEVPGEDKVTALREFLGGLGLTLAGKTKPSPKDYQTLLNQLGDRPETGLVQTVLLRSMKQAVYSPENNGHFGLAYDAYAHFTSPIRRYPDLLLHRALRYLIRSRVASEHVERVRGARRLAKATFLPYTDKDMVELGMRLSTSERRADAATRDVVDWLKCEFMQDRVGEVFEGIINAVTGFGLFVQLKDVYVEGLVHISNLENDYYHFNAVTHSLDGEHSGVSYRLADTVTVRVAAVDLDNRKIDFELLSSTTTKRRKKPLKAKKPSAATKRRRKPRAAKPADKTPGVKAQAGSKETTKAKSNVKTKAKAKAKAKAKGNKSGDRAVLKKKPAVKAGELKKRKKPKSNRTGAKSRKKPD